MVLGSRIAGTTGVAALPYSQVVDYISFLFREYVDTGIQVANDVTIEGSMAFTTIAYVAGQGLDNGLFGGGNSSDNRFWLNYYSNHFAFGFGTNQAVSDSVSENERFDVVFNKIEGDNHVFKINNASYVLTGGSSATDNITIGQLSESNGLKSAMRLYSFKMWKAGVCVRDFLPVIDLNGYAALYDKVSGTVFGNASGDGALGAPVSHRITWDANKTFTSSGSLTTLQVASVSQDLIPVLPNHSLTWSLGFGESPSESPSPFCCVYQVDYYTNYPRFTDYWLAKDRTFTPSVCNYLRVTVKTDFIDKAFIYDNTAGKYLMKDGMIIV